MRIVHHGLQCGVHTVNEPCVKKIVCRLCSALWQCCSLGSNGLRV
jgi:hypothetical protein